MAEDILIKLGIIVLLGFSAQIFSWWLKIPSILLLLVLGIISGPVLQFINPDKMLGDLLMPFVSISVGIILFEGGLTLKKNELKKIGRAVTFLISIGAVITWIISSAAAYLIFGLSLPIAVLLGAILTVTGPTVVGPMLRNIRPKRDIQNILKWEGILIDPIGALLAILTFEVIIAGEIQHAASTFFMGFVFTILTGIITGAVFAAVFTLLIKKYLIPNYLHATAALAFVIGAFLTSNILKAESGLLATTVMGIALANQKYIPVKKIKDFKENLSVILIPILFIILASRLSLAEISLVDYNAIFFLAVILFMARPISVFLSTVNSGLSTKDKLFISWMAPRGIIAAAVSSVFALKLAAYNIAQTEYLVAVTFMVIIGSVGIYSLTSPALARILKISHSNPQGVIIAGAQDWALEIASILNENNFTVVMIDTNRYNVAQAKQMGINALQESILSEKILDEINLDGIGKLLSMTSNDEVNSLGVLLFSEIFDNENLYQLPPNLTRDETKYTPQYLRGRFLFGKGIDHSFLTNKFLSGAKIKATNLTDKFTFEEFIRQHGNSAVPLFLVDKDNELIPFNSEGNIRPETNNLLIAMVDEKK